MQQQQSAQQQLPQKVSVPFHPFGEEFGHFGVMLQPAVEKKGSLKVKKKQCLYSCQNANSEKLGVEGLGLCFDAGVHLPCAGNSEFLETAKYSLTGPC